MWTGLLTRTICCSATAGVKRQKDRSDVADVGATHRCANRRMAGKFNSAGRTKTLLMITLLANGGLEGETRRIGYR
jgi:hypothetical protein